MYSIRESVARRPYLWFFPLAFVLSWYPWLLGMLGVEARGDRRRRQAETLVCEPCYNEL